jgi:hypothetical protein
MNYFKHYLELKKNKNLPDIHLNNKILIETNHFYEFFKKSNLIIRLNTISDFYTNNLVNSIKQLQNINFLKLNILNKSNFLIFLVKLNNLFFSNRFINILNIRIKKVINITNIKLFLKLIYLNIKILFFKNFILNFNLFRTLNKIKENTTLNFNLNEFFFNFLKNKNNLFKINNKFIYLKSILALFTLGNKKYTNYFIYLFNTIIIPNPIQLSKNLLFEKFRFSLINYILNSNIIILLKINIRNSMYKNRKYTRFY